MELLPDQKDAKSLKNASSAELVQVGPSCQQHKKASALRASATMTRQSSATPDQPIQSSAKPGIMAPKLPPELFPKQLRATLAS